MQFKTRMMFVIGYAGLLAMSGAAYGQPLPEPKPRPSSAPQQHRAAQAENAVHRAAKGKANQRIASQERAERPRSMPLAHEPKPPSLGWPALVSEARKYMGTNPTDRKRLWCATFMNMVLAKTGYKGTNSDAAKSFAEYGRRISEPKVGAIAVLTRGKRGGHVGVVSGIDANGNPIIISGNHNRRVGEAIYPRSRVIAYVMPSERQPGAVQAAARGGFNRAAPEAGFESPIAELLAAIEAEQSRAERPRQAAARPDNQRQELQRQELQRQTARPERPQQLAQTAAPHLNVQQTAEPEIAPRRDLPLEPALAGFLGIRDRAQSTSRPAAQPQRERRVEISGLTQSR